MTRFDESTGLVTRSIEQSVVTGCPSTHAAFARGARHAITAATTTEPTTRARMSRARIPRSSEQETRQRLGVDLRRGEQRVEQSAPELRQVEQCTHSTELEIRARAIVFRARRRAPSFFE